MAYTFATDQSAIARLRSIAEVFNPHAVGFVKQREPINPGTVVDLGCGPGFSTAMLHDAWPDAHLIGLDNAQHSLDWAKQTNPGVSFICCDLAQDPLPVRADLMYARFLLTHLPEPVERVNGWLTSLNPGGCLYLDECNAIQPGDDVLAQYLAATEGLIDSAGGRLFVGPVISAGSYTGRVEHDRVDVMHIPNATAAGWFTHNVEHVWPKRAYVLDRISEAKRLEMLERLKALAAAGPSGYSVWHMRRMALSC